MSTLEVWKHPNDYGGFSPDGDYLLLSRHRDSNVLDASNWAVACKDFDAQAYDDGREGFATRPVVYHWRAGHWAVGWVEYLMLRADAPTDLLARAQELIERLERYPILDEDDYSEREWNQACDYWQRLSISERIDYLREAGQSIFAARSDCLPSDDNGALFERLRA